MSDRPIKGQEPEEDELYKRAREIIDQEWVAAGVTKEELAQSRRAAWAMASAPSASPGRSRRSTTPRSEEGWSALPRGVRRARQHGPAVEQRPHRREPRLAGDSFDGLLGLVDDIEAELKAIRVALAAIREALHDRARPSPHPD